MNMTTDKRGNAVTVGSILRANDGRGEIGTVVSIDRFVAIQTYPKTIRRCPTWFFGRGACGWLLNKVLSNSPAQQGR